MKHKQKRVHEPVIQSFVILDLPSEDEIHTHTGQWTTFSPQGDMGTWSTYTQAEEQLTSILADRFPVHFGIRPAQPSPQPSLPMPLPEPTLPPEPDTKRKPRRGAQPARQAPDAYIL